MTVEKTDGLPVGVRTQGFEVTVGWGPENTDVEISVEYPDGTWANWNGTRERYITLPREDWEAIVAHVAAEMAEKDRGCDCRVCGAPLWLNGACPSCPSETA